MSTSEWVITILTVGAVPLLIVEGVRAVLQRRNMRANDAKLISESAITLLVPLRGRITELEHDLDATENRANEAARQAGRLTDQLEESQSQVALLSQQLTEALQEVAQLRAALAAALGHNG